MAGNNPAGIVPADEYAGSDESLENAVCNGNGKIELRTNLIKLCYFRLKWSMISRNYRMRRVIIQTLRK